MNTLEINKPLLFKVLYQFFVIMNNYNNIFFVLICRLKVKLVDNINVVVFEYLFTAEISAI